MYYVPSCSVCLREMKNPSLISFGPAFSLPFSYCPPTHNNRASVLCPATASGFG